MPIRTERLPWRSSALRGWLLGGIAPRATALLLTALAGVLLAPPAVASGTPQGPRRPESLSSIFRAEAPPATALSAQRSERDLGNRICAAYPPYCSQVWRDGLARGLPFNALISEVCLHVGLRANEDAGIACAETAIRIVPTLPDAVLVAQQFAPGERDRHAVWHDKSDRQWGAAVARYFQRIPLYCDHATPVIYDYFPCLLREVHFFQAVLKNFRLR